MAAGLGVSRLPSAGTCPLRVASRTDPSSATEILFLCNAEDCGKCCVVGEIAACMYWPCREEASVGVNISLTPFVLCRLCILPAHSRTFVSSSLQEAQQEAYYNVGPFGGDMPNATTNRWYPDLGQNMQGT